MRIKDSLSAISTAWPRFNDVKNTTYSTSVSYD